MRIAIDFDGVIFDKSTGELIKGVDDVLISYAQAGHEITVFTNRPDWEYTSVKYILEGSDIPYDRIICGKPSYDVFIDDRAMKFEGWDKSYIV